MADHDISLVLAAEIQKRFQFFIIALTFGVLSLSVQSASFDSPLVARISELLGWVLLLTSGVVGLWRLEGIPRIHQFIGLQQLAETRLQQLEIDKDRGVRTVSVTTPSTRNYTIEEQIATWQGEIDIAKKAVGTLEGPLNTKYKLQRITLMLGLLSLMVARGYGPLLQIISEVRPVP